MNKKCAYCGRRIEPPIRRHATYCSNACKQANYRLRLARKRNKTQPIEVLN